MKFIRYPQYSPLHKSSVVTIGNFDGIHIGHQALIKQVVDYAQKHGLQSVLTTMQPLAAQYFAGKDNIALLTPFKCKYKLIEALHIDVLCMLNFNARLVNYSAVEFMQNILIDGLRAKHIIIGDDFRFGKDRAGDINTLKQYCQPLGITISNISSITYNNVRVASSKIRQHLQSNDFAKARACLGRSYAIAGKISYGQQLGRKLDFPTINIKLGTSKLPINGIFCVKVKFKSGKEYLGAASIGVRPTVTKTPTNILEVYILDFNKQVYGQNVEVLFYHKLRNEVKFEGLDELKRQIDIDVLATRQFFANISVKYKEKSIK